MNISGCKCLQPLPARPPPFSFPALSCPASPGGSVWLPRWVQAKLRFPGLPPWAPMRARSGWAPALTKADHGGLPQEYLLESITLLATEVKPRVDRLLAAK